MMKIISGGVTAPKGFEAAGIEAGIKYENRKDMALIYSTLPCIAAGEATYWFCLTGFVHRFWHLKPRSLGRMNRISGVVIGVVGLGLMIKGLTMILA